jgi:hypothetical protein
MVAVLQPFFEKGDGARAMYFSGLRAASCAPISVPAVGGLILLPPAAQRAPLPSPMVSGRCA